MLVIVLQFALALTLFIGAIRLQVSISRQRSKEWEQILAGIAQLDGCLSQLSHGSIFSGGLDCPVDEVWDRIGGKRGIWAIFRNAGVLLEAMNYMEKIGEPNPRLLRTIGQLRKEGRHVRIVASVAFLKCLLTFPGRSACFAAGETASEYIALVAQTSLAISDNCPELLIQYRYFITQS